MCNSHTPTPGGTTVHGIHHYPCPVECSIVQTAIENITEHLGDCASIRFSIEEGGSAIIELLPVNVDGPQPGFQPTRRIIEHLFEAVPDLSLWEVIAVNSDHEIEYLVDQFDLCVTVSDDDEDEADDYDEDGGASIPVAG